MYDGLPVQENEEDGRERVCGTCSRVTVRSPGKRRLLGGSPGLLVRVGSQCEAKREEEMRAASKKKKKPLSNNPKSPKS